MQSVIKLAMLFALLFMVTVGCSKVIPETKEKFSNNNPTPNTIEQRSVSNGVTSLQRQVELLQEAFTSQTPEEAVDKWASSVKGRNGAVQFAILSPELKEKLHTKYEEMMWVTGTSSPWVNRFTISDEQKISEEERKYNVQFELATSTGSAGNYKVEVIVKKYSDKWYIVQILSSVSGLFPQ